MSRSVAESESAEVAPRRAEIDPQQLIGAGAREGVWTVGEAEDVAGRLHFTLGRELSDEQVAEYKVALAFVLERQEQPALKLVIGNYREYRALEASLVISSATSATRPLLHQSDYLFHLRRVLLNWLTSMRLFDDHTIARLTRTYGGSSTELAAYNTARAAAYDNNPSYRFVCQLRHYAQHCGMVPIQGSVTVDRAGAHVELFFDRDELLQLQEFSGWKQVKADLVQGPPRVNLDDHIEAAMNAVVELGRVVAKLDEPLVKRRADAIRETVGPRPEQPNRRTMLMRLRTEIVDGVVRAKVDMFPAALVNEPGDSAPDPVDVSPDFRAERPELDIPQADFTCMGPMDRFTYLPAETCSLKATRAFCFPHQEGIAFIFACDQHAMSIGEWAGRKFGGCFGGDVTTAPSAMAMAARSFARVDIPHGAEFESLVAVPNPPRVTSLFRPEPPVSESARGV